MFETNLEKDVYIDFLIKGHFNKNSKLNNFFQYIFGYQDNIKHKEIFDTDFFNSDYYGSSIDKLFPLSSMPKNGNCFDNTYLHNKNGDVQIHMFLEEDNEQFTHLISTISDLMENGEEFSSCYINENMIVHDIFEIKQYGINTITMENNESEYKEIWNSTFKNIVI